MSKLEFTDGEKFDTSGEFRTVERKDGLYVVGHEMLVPINSNAEGRRIIRAMQEKKDREEHFKSSYQELMRGVGEPKKS